jgi:hypothetical protein
LAGQQLLQPSDFAVQWSQASQQGQSPHGQTPVSQQSHPAGHTAQQPVAADSVGREFPSHIVRAAVAANNPLNTNFTIMVVSLSRWEWTDRGHDGGPPADRGAAGSEKAD